MEKNGVDAGLGAVALGAMALVAFYFTDPDREAWFAAVTAFAISAELAFWVTAGVLGITVFESRKKILRFLSAPFSAGARDLRLEQP